MTSSRGCRDRDLIDATDVAKWRMCIGCGACVYACPDDKLRMTDVVDQGLRPVKSEGDCGGCSDCVDVCPGVGVSHPQSIPQSAIDSLLVSWGPVLEVWEGHATDFELRHSGSSGGLASAIALYCIEKGEMSGVLHVGHDEKVRFRNKTEFSRNRSEILSATGSRYSPASPCDGLQAIEDADSPCVFIGKPCDVEGVRKAQLLRPRLGDKLGVAIGIFCAGTPSTQGTVDLLNKHGVDPGAVEEVRYRGRGWPGSFAVRMKGDTTWQDLASYAEAWGFLQAYRPYRCYICPDSTSEFADISCGDPWYRPAEPDEPGLSLVLVRTEVGRSIVRAAVEAGYVKLQPVEPRVLDLSQRELQLKRGAIWGRLQTMRLMGVPAPRFVGFSLFRNWLRLPLAAKARSVAGTARRIIARRYRTPDVMRQVGS